MSLALTSLMLFEVIRRKKFKVVKNLKLFSAVSDINLFDIIGTSHPDFQ